MLASLDSVYELMMMMTRFVRQVVRRVRARRIHRSISVLVTTWTSTSIWQRRPSCLVGGEDGPWTWVHLQNSRTHGSTSPQ